MRAATSPKTIGTDDGDGLHLKFLDGLRGLAALYVLFSHCVGQTSEGVEHKGQHVSAAFTAFGDLLPAGSDAVAVFIVLSGFCLMMPVVRNAHHQLSGGLNRFFRKRSLRILPPYYAAAVIGVLSILVGSLFKHATGMNDGNSNAMVNLSLGDLVTHFFLVHDFFQAFSGGIEPPLWSVAVEWQIYFIFALVLLPLWRKSGIVITLATAFAVGIAPHFLLPEHSNLDWMRPWMLGLFAMGMCGAVISFDQGETSAAIRRQTPWAIVAISVFIITYGILEWTLHLKTVEVLIHPLVGIIAVAAILYCIERVRLGTPPGVLNILRLLQSRFATFIGSFSYSLYLVHGLIITRVRVILQKLPLHGTSYYVVSLCLQIACSIVAAYGFHLLFEKPFINLKRNTLEPAREIVISSA